MTNKQGSHFWFMVIQRPQPDGTTDLCSYQGTRTPQRGETRLDAFNAVRTLIADEYPGAPEGVVAAFDIQPNKL